MIQNLEFNRSEEHIGAAPSAVDAAANGVLFVFCTLVLVLTGAVLMLHATA